MSRYQYDPSRESRYERSRQKREEYLQGLRTSLGEKATTIFLAAQSGLAAFGAGFSIFSGQPAGASALVGGVSAGFAALSAINNKESGQKMRERAYLARQKNK